MLLLLLLLYVLDNMKKINGSRYFYVPILRRLCLMSSKRNIAKHHGRVFILRVGLWCSNDLFWPSGEYDSERALRVQYFSICSAEPGSNVSNTLEKPNLVQMPFQYRSSFWRMSWTKKKQIVKNSSRVPPFHPAYSFGAVTFSILNSETHKSTEVSGLIALKRRKKNRIAKTVLRSESETRNG